ncbi:MAG: M14 family metallopeptidase [Oligoflexia bacterium]|nr:M14 family metallopeptidase [Oligoflexia bacterium]
MTSWKKCLKGLGIFIILGWLTTPASVFASGTEPHWVQIAASSKEARTQLAGLGVSIDAVRSDSVWALVDEPTLREVKANGFRILGDFERPRTLDFPPEDGAYHNYTETVSTLRSLRDRHADITFLQSIGKSVEGRELWALHINTSGEALKSGKSAKPGVIIMANHHAREHLTAELALKLAQYLLDNRGDARIGTLLDTRDIWVVPMVNPDGVEFDIATSKYRMWRKNRAANPGGVFGVDLNRNYGFKWGTGGSSNNPRSDTYMGPAPFSEPETQAVRDFVRSQPNTKVLLSLHTFSELVLYPWGSSYDPIENTRDHAVFKKMAETMAGWNGYKPQQSSELYLASGDTTDWAYGELGIFAFTFELSPASGFAGFYPGVGMIEKAFNDNLKPALYLLEVANDPYQVVDTQPSGWLKNYVAPRAPATRFFDAAASAPLPY